MQGRFHILRRLFLLTLRIRDLPVDVLHDCSRYQESMQVCQVSLFNVGDTIAPVAIRAETVMISSSACPS